MEKVECVVRRPRSAAVIVKGARLCPQTRRSGGRVECVSETSGVRWASRAQRGHASRMNSWTRMCVGSRRRSLTRLAAQCWADLCLSPCAEGSRSNDHTQARRNAFTRTAHFGCSLLTARAFASQHTIS